MKKVFKCIRGPGHKRKRSWSCPNLKVVSTESKVDLKTCVNYYSPIIQKKAIRYAYMTSMQYIMHYCEHCAHNCKSTLLPDLVTVEPIDKMYWCHCVCSRI